MSRLTITLSDEMHRALKEASARQGRSITAIIEESLRFRGIRDRDSARSLVERARSRSGMNESDAIDLAVTETRQARG